MSFAALIPEKITIFYSSKEKVERKWDNYDEGKNATEVVYPAFFADIL